MSKKLSNNQVLLKQIIQQEFADSSGFQSIGEYFEYFSSSEILKNYQLSDDEIIHGISGGGQDGGCDSLFVFLNEELLTEDLVETLDCPLESKLSFYIIQSKYQQTFSQDVFLKWKDTLSNLLPLESDVNKFETQYNDKVREAFQIFKDCVLKFATKRLKISFNFYYVSLGDTPHPNVLSHVDSLKELVIHNYPECKVNVSLTSADELLRMYNSECDTTAQIDFVELPICLSEDDFIGLIKLDSYFNFITNEKNELNKSLFNSNIRDYQGNNSVNSSIANTLLKNSSVNFWWLNNGVTIISEEIGRHGNKSLLVKNPQIVNGLQTSREIFSFFSEYPNMMESEWRSVLIRIINPKNEEIRDQIIFSTNNQTNIPKSSLRVTDPIHLQIELFFKNKGLFYDRRKNYYKNQKKKPSDIISVSFLAQCLISLVLCQPDYARARPSTILSNDDIYEQLYLTDCKLDSYFNAAKLGRKIELSLKTLKDINRIERNDILFYVIYAVGHQLLNKETITIEDLSALDVNNISNDLILETAQKILQLYKDEGGNSTVAKDPNFINSVKTLFSLY